jgi:deoxyribodipyrimidine photolyase
MQRMLSGIDDTSQPVVKRDTIIKKTLSKDGLRRRKLRRQSPVRTITHCNEARESISGFSHLFWRALLARDEPAEPTAAPRKVKPVRTTVKSLSLKSLKLLPQPDWSGVMTKTWNPGEAGAKKLLKSFLSQGLEFI